MVLHQGHVIPLIDIGHPEERTKVSVNSKGPGLHQNNGTPIEEAHIFGTRPDPGALFPGTILKESQDPGSERGRGIRHAPIILGKIFSEPV